MASNELRKYPRGQISFKNGDLTDAILARFSFTNNAKLKHSLRKSPSGIVMGNRECTGSIELEVSEDGIERDVYTMAKSGEVVQFRYKLPALSKAIEGVINQVDTEMPLDDAVKVTFNFIGNLVDT